MARMARDLVDFHTLCESVNVIMKITINFYDMATLPYLVIKERSLSRCGLLDHILCEWRLMRHYFERVWVILGGWGIILGG